jgi:hypothetical protein
MAWLNSIEILSKLIPIAQILIVILTVFTIWATVHRGNLEKLEKAKLAQEIAQTKLVTGELTKKNTDLQSELRESKTELTKKNLDLEAELKESKTRLSGLKKKTEPRSLLSEQKTKLNRLLPPPAPFQIAAACRLMDTESCNYAEELIAVFRDLKWQIGITNKTFLDDIQGDVVVAITEDAQIPIADGIMKALNKVGLKASNESVRKEGISGVQANTIYLIVGARKKNP